jgi:rhamnose transport system substrate-binding protein
MPIFLGSSSPTVQQQIDIIEQLIEQRVSGIAVDANDADALQSVLTTAMNSGINVVSLDSAVNKNSRQLHIQQADPEQIGRSLIQSAYDMIDGEGGIAVLSSTEQAPNQNLWIEWMQKELAEYPKKYEKTPLVKIVYGDDDLTKSTAEAEALVSDTSIKAIIAPTIVGMQAAADVISKTRSDIKLTGLGMPSTTAQYIEDGTCPEMYLWDPSNIGYLAGYTLDALKNNSITGAVGESFTAGELGDKTVTADLTGGTEVILGEPLKFDLSNIDYWKNIF